MKITAKIDRLVQKGNIKAIASVSLDGMFVVKGLKVMDSRKGLFVSMVYENHGIDSRYTGPHDVVPTISARCGTGGNNVPLVGTNRRCIALLAM